MCIRDRSTAHLMDTQTAGISSYDKRIQIAQLIKEQDANCAVITALDSICWLLNIRGTDVSRLPVLLSQAIIFNDGRVQFFIDSSRLPAGFEAHAGANVEVYRPEQYESQLQSLSGKKVLVDPATSSAWLSITLENNNASVVSASDPCST